MKNEERRVKKPKIGHLWVKDRPSLPRWWPIFGFLILHLAQHSSLFILHSSLKNRPSNCTFSAPKGRGAEILCHFHAHLPLGKIIGARGSCMFFWGLREQKSHYFRAFSEIWHGWRGSFIDVVLHFFLLIYGLNRWLSASKRKEVIGKDTITQLHN